MSWVKQRKEMLEQLQNQGMPLHEIEFRRSGRSTGMALEFLGRALLSPERTIKVYDHDNNHSSASWVLNLCMDLVNQLNLKGFAFNKTNLSIVFSLEEK